MADSNTNWIFNLIDGFTKPLKEILSGFNKMENTFDDTTVGIVADVESLKSKLSDLKKKLKETTDTGDRMKIRKEIDSTTNSIDKLELELAHTNKTASKTESIFSKMGQNSFNLNQITESFRGVADGLIGLTGNSESFEFTMKKVNTMAQLGSVDFETLKDKVLNVADNVEIARDSLGEGLYQVISNGVPENNWIDFLEKSSKASVGGIANLSKVVDVTTTVIKNYGLEWDKASDIQDKIQNAAVLGKTSFEEMASSLPSVAGGAAQLGVNIDELLGSFSALTGVTGNTSEVATQLQGVFAGLLAPTTEAEKKAKQLQVTFDAMSIEKAGGLVPFMQNLTTQVEAYAKKTGESSKSIYATLFGSTEARKAIIALTGELADDFAEKTDKIVNSAGTIEKAYAEMADASVNRTIKLQNQIDSFKDGIFNLTKEWMPLIKVGSEQLVVFSQMAPALSAIKSGFGSMIGTILKAIPAQWGLNAAMLANPISLIIVGIVALVAAIVWMIANFDKVSEWFKNQPGIIKIAFAPIYSIAKLGRWLVDNWQPVVTFFKALPGFVQQAFDWIVEIISTYNPFSILIDSLDYILPGLKAKIFEVWEMIKSNLIDPIKEAIENVFSWLFTKPTSAPQPRDLTKPKQSGKEDNTGLELDNILKNKGFAQKAGAGQQNASPIKIGGESGAGKSITMNLDIKNYFSIKPENMDNSIKKFKQLITDALVDSARDASIIALS